MNNFETLKNILLNNSSFLITTHVNPDADAICSEIALYYILKKLDKKVSVVNNSSTPYNLEFLDEEKIIEKYNEQIHKNIFNKIDVLLLLDLNQTNRVMRMEESVKKFDKLKVCIDHHQNPENFYDYFIGGSEYSATGEIIYDFIKETNIVEMDYQIAYQLYTAIMTDTGSFRFDRTSSKVHTIISDLLSFGINPTEIYDKVYDQFHFNRIKLLGDALNSVKLDSTKQIAYMVLTKETQVKNNSVEADVDGFVNYCLSIKGVKIGILLYEINDGLKVSFRSKGSIPVNKLAAEFNGGGHTNAAGARFNNTKIEGILDSIIIAAQKYIKDGE